MEFPLNQIDECMKEKAPMKLPCSIRPARQLPTGCRLGLVAYNRQDGTVDVLKVLHFETRITKDEDLGLCAGTPYALVLRPGPWALKKAVFGLIDRLPGFHVAWFALKTQ